MSSPHSPVKRQSEGFEGQYRMEHAIYLVTLVGTALVVAAAFSQRRKTLRNALRALGEGERFERSGIDLGRRGETLSVAEFVRLSDAES